MKHDCTQYELQLTDYTAGDLTEPDRAAVENHLAQCAACRSELAREVELRTALVDLPLAQCPDSVTSFLRASLDLADTARAPAQSGSSAPVDSFVPSGWRRTGLGLVAATLVAALLIPGLLERAREPEPVVARANQANLAAVEFSDAEIEQARRDVVATLTLTAGILDRSRDRTVAEIFGARLPAAISGSLRPNTSDAQKTNRNSNETPTGGNG